MFVYVSLIPSLLRAGLTQCWYTLHTHTHTHTSGVPAAALLSGAEPTGAAGDAAGQPSWDSLLPATEAADEGWDSWTGRVPSGTALLSEQQCRESQQTAGTAHKTEQNTWSECGVCVCVCGVCECVRCVQCVCVCEGCVCGCACVIVVCECDVMNIV